MLINTTRIVTGARSITRIILLSVKDEEGRRLADDLDGFGRGYTVTLEHVINLNAEGSERKEVKVVLGLLVRDGDAGAGVVDGSLKGDLE
tara:strand:+ start:315 stop:584 length:270 start_codon:yes stop_codon:yes gene_type:complete